MSPPLPTSTRLSLWGSIPEVLLQLLSVQVPLTQFVITLQPAPSHVSPSPSAPIAAPSPRRAQPSSTVGTARQPPCRSWAGSLGALLAPSSHFLTPGCLALSPKRGLRCFGGVRRAGCCSNGPSSPPQDADGPAEAARSWPLRAHGRPRGGRAGPAG